MNQYGSSSLKSFKNYAILRLSASLVAQPVKNLPAMQETWVRSLGWEDCLEKGMAIHSSILTWRIPWTEEPGWLQFIGEEDLVSSCSGGLRPLVELCVEPAGLCGRCTGAGLPFGPRSQASLQKAQGPGKRKVLYIFTWVSLMAQLVKNPPAMQETWV